jgi:hypothetical protein
MDDMEQKEVRQSIYRDIEAERRYQDEKWGDEFDSKNTLNDWVTYITVYAGRAAEMGQETPRQKLLKVATLVVAALEQEEWPKRHYDK